MMQVKVYAGSEHDVQELARALVQLGIRALAYNPIRHDVWGVYVPETQHEEARALVDALDHITALAARQRVRDAVVFRGGREIGGVA